MAAVERAIDPHKCMITASLRAAATVALR
jgi:hypothetical protein